MGLTTSSVLSIEQYLDASFHPDRDYVDGETERRHVGELNHSLMQTQVVYMLKLHAAEWKIIPLTEQRVRVTESRVRIPDVCALRADAPREPVTTTPPLLCVEVLSRKDRFSRVLQVMEDYRRMGVDHLWLVDPSERIAYTYTSEGLQKVRSPRLEIAGTPIYLEPATLFSALD